MDVAPILDAILEGSFAAVVVGLAAVLAYWWLRIMVLLWRGA